MGMIVKLVVYIAIIIALLLLLKWMFKWMLYIIFLTVIYFGCFVYDILFLRFIHKTQHSSEESQSSFYNLVITCWNNVYDTPFLSLCITIIPILFFMGNYYYRVIFLYVVVYLLGMKCRYKNNDEEYQKVIAINYRFLKISITIAYGLITFVSFIVAVTGWQYDMSISLTDRFLALESNLQLQAENIKLDTVIATFVMALINVFLIALLCYIASLPLQLIAYWFINIIRYKNKSDNIDSYNEMLKMIPFINIDKNFLYKQLIVFISVFIILCCHFSFVIKNRFSEKQN